MVFRFTGRYDVWYRDAQETVLAHNFDEFEKELGKMISAHNLFAADNAVISCMLTDCEIIKSYAGDEGYSFRDRKTGEMRTHKLDVVSVTVELTVKNGQKGNRKRIDRLYRMLDVGAFGHLHATLREYEIAKVFRSSDDLMNIRL